MLHQSEISLRHTLHTKCATYHKRKLHDFLHKLAQRHLKLYIKACQKSQSHKRVQHRKKIT